jgi:branched-chain amino acid transport system permease protein
VLHWLDANFVSLLNGVAVGMLLFTMAVGLSLIFGLMDVLNLAHGAVFMLGSYVAFHLVDEGRRFVPALLAAVVLGAGLGVGMAFAVRPLVRRGPLDQALLTLGLAFVLSNLALAVWGTDFHSVRPPPSLGGSVDLLGHTYPVYRLAIIVLGLVLAAAVHLVVERTRLGAVIRAAVVDRAMVSALGINVSLLLVGVFAAGVVLAAFGGVVGAPVLNVRPGLDSEVLILALLVVVIGGLGSLRGAFVGALLIGQVQALGVALLPQQSSFLLFGAMALILLARPSGLFGDAAR